MPKFDAKELVASVKGVVRDLPFPIVEPFVFPRESMWLRANHKPVVSQDTSVILFTMHKVASTFTHQLLSELNDEILGLRRMDWDRYANIRFPVNTTSWLADHEEAVFAKRGHVYGPFRAALPITDLSSYRTLLLLRDPRDMLTSGYFSEAFSHPVPWNKERRSSFEEQRARAQKLSIDEWVLERSSDVGERLAAYRQLAADVGITPLTYEHMMADFDGFLDRVEERLSISIGRPLRDRLRSLGRIGQTFSGDQNSHMRKGQPGDHAFKLRKETIESLNTIFAEDLEWLRLA